MLFTAKIRHIIYLCLGEVVNLKTMIVMKLGPALSSTILELRKMHIIVSHHLAKALSAARATQTAAALPAAP